MVNCASVSFLEVIVENTIDFPTIVEGKFRLISIISNLHRSVKTSSI